MARIERFEDLESWQEARYLVSAVYKISKEHLKGDPSLRDQLQRASVSIMANIAEGFEGRSDAEKVRFLIIARGSAAEVRSLLYVVKDVGLAKREEIEHLQESCRKIGRLISGLINHLRK